MTACVNNTEKKAKGGVFQSKVLRAVMAGVLAIGLMPAVSTSAWAANESFTVSTDQAEYTYTGKEITVEVTVAYDKNTTVSNDRTLTYSGPEYGEAELDGNTTTPGSWTPTGDSSCEQVVDITVTAVGDYTLTLGSDSDAEEATASFSVTSEVATDADRFSAGEVSAVYDHNGYLLTASEDGSYPASAGKAFSRVEVTPFGATEAVQGTIAYSNTKVEANDEPTDTKFAYDQAAAPTAAGTYFAKVSGNGGAVYMTIVVPQKTLEGVFAFEDGDMDDRTFTFDFTNQKDDIDWAIGSEDITASVDVAWYKDGKKHDKDIKDAGTYVAQVKGKTSTEYAGAVTYVEVTVEKLDLSTVDFSVEDQEWTGDPIDAGTVAPKSDTYADFTTGNLVDWKLSGPTTSGLVIDKGTYTWTGTVATGTSADANAKNLEGTATVTFDVRGTLVDAAAFQYENPADSVYTQVNNGAFMTAENPLSFDRSDADVDKQGFNPAKLQVVKDAAKKVNYVQGEDYTLSYEKENEDGSWTAVTDVTASGSYRVIVTMSSAKDLAGKATAYFTVTNGTVGAPNYFVSYEGEALEGNVIEATYDGTDVTDDIDVVVKKGDVTLAEGVDYTVKYTLDGEEVDSIVNADDYVMTIHPVTYTGDDAVVTIKVSPVTITDVRAYTGSFSGLLYTGSEITPQIEYATEDNPFTVMVTPEKGEPYYVANPDYASSILPSDLYDVRDIKFTAEDAEKAVSVDALLEPGDYEFGVVLYGDSQNFKFAVDSNKTANVTVLDKLTGFADVNSTDWFVGPVNTVNNAGWMNGFAGTGLFGPNADITRADVVCVLYNVAGGIKLAPTEYPAASEFSDVAGYMYYTAPINWAAKTGIANGYDADTFGPNDPITREQFASLLANFAEAYGVYVAPTTDISGMPGADGVSGWALENVKWAVENGIMGNNGADLNAQGTITRAEVAAMVSNYAEAFDLI